jgi:Fuc2NAc and GlcNAc transferase
VGYGLALMTLVWLLNLWNFMDGIDGLAAGEAVFVCVAGVLLRVTEHGQLPPLTLLLAAATLGFLFWNFPPASIFMGDVGSGFLGIALAMTGIIEFGASVRHGAAWLILPAFFISDATLTLIRRWRQGIPVATAHRTHAYQHAAQRWGNHRTVTVAVAVLNACYLLPLALLVQHQIVGPGPGLALAYLPVTIAVWMLGAGIDRRAA